MLRFLVFQHMPWEGPGSHLLRAAKKQRVRLDIAELWHKPIPDIDPYNGVIVLGGAPNVNEEQKYPFLKSEKEAIQHILKKDKAYLGFCLGHQLLADALKAQVGPNFCTSIGFAEGRLTKEGRVHPMFHNISQCLPLFKWHTQAVIPPLPKEVYILATSQDCQVEAISVQDRPHLVGMQFDNHAAAISDVKTWIAGDQKLLSSKGIDGSNLLQSTAELESLIGAQFDIMFENYIRIIS